MSSSATSAATEGLCPSRCLSSTLALEDYVGYLNTAGIMESHSRIHSYKTSFVDAL
jgi:hypothetical protein